MNEIKNILNIIGYQKSETKIWMEFLTHLGELLKEKEINQFMTNPNFTVNKRVEMLTEVMNKYPLNAQVINSMLIAVIEDNLINNFEDVIKSYQELSNQLNDVMDVTLISASKLNKEKIDIFTKDLEDKLQKNINLKVVHDESLIGGAKVVLNGKIFDNTVKNKVEKLKKKLMC